MTKSEIKRIVNDITDEQLAALFGKIDAEVSTSREKADRYDSEQESITSIKEQLQQALDEAKRTATENSRLLNRTKVQAKFVEAGIKEECYNELLDSIVSENEDASLAFADSLIRAFSANAASAVEAAKQESMQTPPPVSPARTSARPAHEKYKSTMDSGSVIDIIRLADAAFAEKNMIIGG